MTPGATHTQQPDEELIRLTALGNCQAFALLYDRYSPLLFGLLLRILRSRAEAEDVLQEVFIEVWLRAFNFDETRGRLFTWLVILTRSRAIDRARALASRHRATTEAQFEGDSRWVSSDACEDAIRSEQSRIVREAIATLPVKQRRALLLAYFDGLSQAQIAAHLGVPLGTVKTRTRCGLMRLGQLLRDPVHAADRRRGEKATKLSGARA